MLRRCLLPVVLCLAFLTSCWAQTPAEDGVQVLADLPYKQGSARSDYEKDRCKLDLYLPKEARNFATLVWFHGGGLKNGDKNGTQIATDSVKTTKIARSLAAAGIAVVTPNYRFSPKVTFPAYVEDAAAAVVWARKEIVSHGGDPARVFIGGHSAGAYLALMLGMDPHYLGDLGLPLSEIAGIVPVSGQTMTHYTVREEQGIGKFTITADQAAPVHFIRPNTPPFLVLYGDHDMAARAEENALFVALMKAAGNQRVSGQMMMGRTHGSIASEIVNENDPARMAILKFMAGVRE